MMYMNHVISWLGFRVLMRAVWEMLSVWECLMFSVSIQYTAVHSSTPIAGLEGGVDPVHSVLFRLFMGTVG